MHIDYLALIREYADSHRIEWKRHALRRILERGIARAEVFEAIGCCEIVEEYIEDKPLPCFLVLGYTKNNRPLHVVLAVDRIEMLLWVITVYEPSKEEWEMDLKTRRKR